MFNLNAKRNSMLMIIMVLCTMTIIGTNYIFTKNIVLDMNEYIIENEYKKIGGKENYIILQEIQKREILSYLDSIKNEQPGLIKEILDNQIKVEKSNSNILEKNIINDLKKDTYVKGNSGALISIIEFSDLECSFCKTQHINGIFNEALDKNKTNINYVFKNFPIPNHKNSEKEAQAGMCVYKLSGGEKYLKYIDSIFNETISGGEGYDLKKLPILAEKLEIDKNKFNECFSSGATINQIQKEFVQGRMLGVNSVPSSFIINNNTGEYKLITELMDYNTLEDIINELLN